MVFAETAVGLEMIAGGGVTGMLAIVMTAFLRRTKETDERRDEASNLIMSTSAERESRAWAERDAALTELATARAELARVNALLDARREVNDQ
jgi:hypothetical protein